LQKLEDEMKRFLPSLLGGFLAGASVWITQSYGLSSWLTGLAGGVGAFVGTYAGQKLLDAS
jgi:uncharacterized membrane protein YfcA